MRLPQGEGFSCVCAGLAVVVAKGCTRTFVQLKLPQRRELVVDFADVDGALGQAARAEKRGLGLDVAAGLCRLAAIIVAYPRPLLISFLEL